MASEIISETVDENFPVAGQDNDSQGFRDNFNIIKTGLGIANAEITDLQTGVVRKDSSDNNFDGNSIQEANFQSCTFESTQTYITGTNGLASIPIDWTDGGSVHIINVRDADTTLSFTGLPVDQYAVMRFILTADDVARNVTFSLLNGGDVKLETGLSNPLSVTSSTDPIVIETFSYSSTMLFVRSLGSFA